MRQRQAARANIWGGQEAGGRSAGGDGRRAGCWVGQLGGRAVELGGGTLAAGCEGGSWRCNGSRGEAHVFGFGRVGVLVLHRVYLSVLGKNFVQAGRKDGASR